MLSISPHSTAWTWRLFQVYASKAVNRYLTDASSLIKAGLSKSDTFQLLSDNGYKTVLSPKYTSEISRHPALSFSRVISSENHTHIKGFDAFKQFSAAAHAFQNAVRIELTRALGGIAKPLSEEVSLALQKNWGDNLDWHDLPLKPTIQSIVAQLSSRVFLGDQICRNPEWLQITVDHSVDSLRAGEELRLWPYITRPVVALFLQSCRKVRQDLLQARRIITPVLEERRKSKESASRKGVPLPQYNDALEWMEQASKGLPYDPAASQLTFSLAAIITTSDMMTQALFDLCGREELVAALREEIISVISTHGWRKTAMYKLQLMDSFLKESQRLKPLAIVSLRRIAETDVQLEDGTNIAKGTSLLVASDWMRDARFYDQPETFDPYRFLKLRQTPGHEHHAQLVSPSPEHLGFGLGNHVCPGRFFAANEMKIALCHMLLKYDLKLAEGSVPKPRRYGFAVQADGEAKVSIRRRREEIALDDISG
ncbi:uncharacterized protein N7459_008256 [Penicillium hispanicum]|uniref:uncharacterized protein n=1 Tax=Penicillium hispanicum TaxID=1080232 RepID=UPI0025422891|nr:uncharacterized protein N7459_008256 [Penicillium hispanicum]KAJ5573829.1 hypothetical protein N7459_008256 [Penicillium hispanicum]